MMNSSIYKLEEQLNDGRLVEPIHGAVMYDIRKMAENVKKMGRKLTTEEAQQYRI